MQKQSRNFWVTCALVATAAPLTIQSAHAANFKVSGQVDRAVIGADNGKQTDYGFVDNVGSNSRFRFTGDQIMPNGVKLGFNYEMAFAVNPSTDFNINSAGGPSNNNGQHNNFTNVRLGEVYVEGNFGKLSFGKGDGAANGTSEVDLSGTQYLGGGSAHYYASGISFIHDNHVITNGPKGNSAVNIGNGAYNNFDALSRRNRVRYDTPSFGGAVLSASLDNGHAYEIAGRYNATFAGGAKLEAAVDWVDSENASDQINPIGNRSGRTGRFQEYGGSASLLLPSGLNVTGMYKKHDRVGNNTGPNATSFFTGVGYIVGRNHFQVGWGGTRDYANNGSKGNSYQAAYVFDWTKSVQLYGSYHMITLDHVYDSNVGHNVSAKNINYLFLGTRVKFL